MNANLIQARLIERYAARHGLNSEQAARVWIPRHARAFRAWFNRRAA
jgi:acetyl-CoA acetyltransferase